MKFEHLIQINDLNNPMVHSLSRGQLWRGLVLRVEFPKHFMQHIDSVTLSDKTLDSVRRTLQYGDLYVTDVVKYLPQLQIHIDVPEQGEIARSHMRMVIEEPEEGDLFVRFIYQTEDRKDEDGMQQMYDDFRRSAYKEADVDAIRLIRQLAESGGLE